MWFSLQRKHYILSLRRWLFAIASIIFSNAGLADFYSAVDAPRLLNFNLGEVEILDSETNPRYGMEYRHSPIGRWNLLPSAGFAFSENDASYYYLGLRRDFRLKPNWLMTGSFDTGFFEDGEGLTLGNTVEFRSGIEIAFEMKTGSRLGLGFFHLSNGSISDENPGTEALVFAVMLPLKPN